jgi:hypothetical protein
MIVEKGEPFLTRSLALPENHPKDLAWALKEASQRRQKNAAAASLVPSNHLISPSAREAQSSGPFDQAAPATKKAIAEVMEEKGAEASSLQRSSPPGDQGALARALNEAKHRRQRKAAAAPLPHFNRASTSSSIQVAQDPSRPIDRALPAQEEAASEKTRGSFSLHLSPVPADASGSEEARQREQKIAAAKALPPSNHPCTSAPVQVATASDPLYREITTNKKATKASDATKEDVGECCLRSSSPPRDPRALARALEEAKQRRQKQAAAAAC